MRKKFIWIVVILLLGLVLAGCGLAPASPTAGESAEQIYTQAAQTVFARQTGIALTMQPAGETQAPGLPTQTAGSIPQPATPTLPPPPATPTSTQEPTPTLLPSPTPTLAPTPTVTPIPIPCDRARYVADVTVPDGSVYLPGADFVKIWRIRNVGSCTWTTGYDLVFESGDRMDGQRSVPLPNLVRPNDTVDVSVELTAPEEAGSYRGYWMLRNEQGDVFAAGVNGEVSFWVDIEVVEIDSKDSFNFAANYCLASWRSERGLLPCPGVESSEEGFVYLLSNPDLENRHEDELAIWTHPNERNSGYISGVFPAITIQPGDRFVAWVGCLDDSPRCDVTFELSYQVGGGATRSLGQWRETNDGHVTVLDIPLFDLAEQQVKFILSTYVNDNPEQADGFWFMPRIDHLNAPPPPLP